MSGRGGRSSFRVSPWFDIYRNNCISIGNSHRVFVTNRSQHRSVGSDAFKPLPLVTLSGPGEGLPQVLCGPLLADDARGELKMRIDVRVGAIRCFSAPQTRSASLPRRIRSCCSSTPPPPCPAPPRAAGRSIRPLRDRIIASCTLTPQPSVVAGVQDEGKGGGR